MSAAIPIALIEDDVNYAVLIRRSLLPRFDVLPGKAQAAGTLTAILSGHLDGPGELFGIGSNSHIESGADRKVPRAVVLASTIFPEDASAMRDAAQKSPAGNIPVEQVLRGDPDNSIRELLARLNGLVDEGVLRAE